MRDVRSIQPTTRPVWGEIRAIRLLCQTLAGIFDVLQFIEVPDWTAAVGNFDPTD